MMWREFVSRARFLISLVVYWVFGALCAQVLHAAPTPKLGAIDFEVVKLEASPETNPKTESPTLLLLGGIQGDEPGGFNATNIFLNHYRLKTGSVWVVPVLNPHSMLLNHRGIYDDMNRKFAELDPKDPEAPLIAHVKELINDERVQAVLHLHDGSGYYRPHYESKLANPNRWGNCTIIDQALLEGAKFGELQEIATHITTHINSHLLAPIHRYYLHNTETAQKDPEMQKALTFYAISQGKPGYANEASKELGVAQRVYYHLLAIEALLEKMGIEYERDFELTAPNVQKAIKDPSQSFALENLPELPLYGLRALLPSFPIPKGKQAHEIAIHSSNKILGLLPRTDEQGRPQLVLKYGNNVMTKIAPKYVEPYTDSRADSSAESHDDKGTLESIQAIIDGQPSSLAPGQRVRVKREIELPRVVEIDDTKTLHVRLVGLKDISNNSSASLRATRAALNPNASLDKAATLYRAELYIREKITPESKAESNEAESSVDSSRDAGSKVESSQKNSGENGALDSSSSGESVDSSGENGEVSSVRVRVNLANIRAKPSIDSAIAGMVGRGKVLEMLDQVPAAPETPEKAPEAQETWLKVRYTHGRTEISGYILASLTSPIAGTTNGSVDDSRDLAQVRVSLAHIRANPSIDSMIVAKAPRGRVMEVRTTTLAESGQAPNAQKWAQIHYIYGAGDKKREINGWVLYRLLEPLEAHQASRQISPQISSHTLDPAPKSPTYKEYFGGMIVLEFPKQPAK